jgi:hypothetical protein
MIQMMLLQEAKRRLVMERQDVSCVGCVSAVERRSPILEEVMDGSEGFCFQPSSLIGEVL